MYHTNKRKLVQCHCGYKNIHINMQVLYPHYDATHNIYAMISEKQIQLVLSSRKGVQLPLQNYKIDQQKANGPCHNQKKLTPRADSFLIC